MAASVIQASIHGTVKFSDGDPVDHPDFNNIQTLNRIAEMDRIFDLLNNYTDDPEGETANLSGVHRYRCFVPRSAGGMPFIGTGLGVSLSKGLIYAKNPAGGAVPAGSDPTVLAYQCPSTADMITLDAADPTNPRIDLIQVKLELIDDTSSVKDFEDAVTRALSDSASIPRRQRVQATWSVKNGTPAASPTKPTATA